jgi:hypothetical protein
MPRVGDLLPVERVSREVIPASTPTTRSTGGAWATVVSTRIDTCHRPAGSRDTVTVDGSAPSGNGRDHTMSSGSAIFANVSRPSRQRNADRVYSADALPRLRDLNRGYRARFSQNAANADCKCRNDCCNGTDDTSLRNVSLSIFFHSVSRADVCA